MVTIIISAHEILILQQVLPLYVCLSRKELDSEATESIEKHIYGILYATHTLHTHSREQKIY